MKCKKILAMLLALCMVLTTFVAVSAEDVVVIDIFEDYSTDIGDTICGGDISLSKVEFEGENVLKVTSSYSGAAGWQSLVGFALEDTDGTQLTIADLPEDGVIEYSFDIYVPTEGGNVGDATAYLRTANGFPPAGMQTRLDELNGLTTGEWITYEGTKNVSDNSWSGDSGSDAPIWICLRANFSAAGTFYLDNFSFTLTQTVEEEEPELPPVSGGIEFELAPKNVAGTLEDGVYTVSSAQLKDFSNNADFSDCSANDWLKIIPTTELDPEKTIKVSYEIKAENLINSIGQSYTDRETTLRIRDAQNNSVVDRTTYRTMVPVNTGVAQLVEFEIPVASIEGYHYFGISLDMMNPLAFGDGTEYFVISNVVVEYVGEEEPEDPIVPPVDPDEPEDPIVPPVDPEEPEEPGEVEYVAIGEQINDFETDMGDVKVGTTNIAGEIVDLDGENVLKVTSSGTTAHNGIVGIQVKDTEGNSINFSDLADYDRVSWRVDLMMEDTSTLPVAGDGAYVGFRYGSWTPSEAMVNAGNFGGNNLTAGQWKTISGTKLIGELNWQSTVFTGDVYFFVRPNFTGNSVMYIDNIEVTVEKEFVPTILEVTEVEVGADNATFNVETDAAIEPDTIVATIDGTEVEVTVEEVDETNTLVKVVGLAPGTEYTFAVTGALNARDREVGVADADDCTVEFTTIAEVDAEAALSGDTVTFELTNNLTETQTIHVVLLRCKGNTVIETIATVVEATPGEPVEDSIEVTELGSGEYYRVFAWSYEDGAINSMANLIDLD